ncbi:extracellular matrix organizing protein FRAS1 [Anabrus simplex]|uniref:extracellular matrix organizing protein FRAS1 n=1 Tax=Anabrus simplex TaxID=316456 RepID=UPI0035A2EE7C
MALMMLLPCLFALLPVVPVSAGRTGAGLHDQSFQSNVIDGGGFTSKSNLMMTVPAGQPTSISSHHLSYISSSLDAQQIVYRVTKPLGSDEGRLVFTDQPHKQIQQFTQADVNSMRLAYLPPDVVDSEQMYSLHLAVTKARTNVELIEQKIFRIKVQPANLREPKFKIVNPKIQLKQVTYVDIPKKYFEIDRMDNDDPNLTFVITEMPRSGSLTFTFENKSFINLEGGNEFYLENFDSGFVRYQYFGDRSQLEDRFEVLATDGNFEIMNMVTLEIIPITPETMKAVIHFEVEEVTVKEDSTTFHASVIREGNLSVQSQVWCDSMDGTARAGSDFIIVNRSLLVFDPGSSRANCEVALLDDQVYEGDKDFRLGLTTLPGDSDVILGNRSILKVWIRDVEDKRTVEFERRLVTVSDDKRQGATVTVNVVRKGDSSEEFRVRAVSRDGTAVRGVDFEELSQLLVFSRGVELLPLRVRVLPRPNRGRTLVFTLELLQNGLVGAELGEKKSVSITIRTDDTAMKVLPSRPLVISLLNHDTATEESGLASGYPLACIHACDSRHPLYNTTQRLCQDTNIKDILYSWEIAPPSAYLSFREIVDSTFFSNVHSKVLDPSFFSRNFKVRCVTTPLSGRGLKGVSTRSKAVNISGDQKTVCSSKHPFVATLDYVNSSSPDVRHRNMIHVHIELPHADGVVPLVSTLPLTNPRVLLLDHRHTAQHLCSNLYNTSAFLTKGVPTSLSAALRDDRTVQLYQHLNLDTCLWTFDAWFHMSELVDNCGGRVISEMQVRENGENYVTVQVPLYVTYLMAGAPLGWTAVDHHTELEVSFHYSSLLWHQGSLAMQPQYNGSIQVTRVGVDADGRLQLDFNTVANFRGQFVLQHRLLPSVMSGVYPPPSVGTNLTLELVWSQRTWDGPHQAWRAVTVYSLQDYTGEYTVTLIPCSVRPGQPYYNGHARQRTDCSPRGPVHFKLPIMFQQSSRPAPLVYSLETQFTITNSQTEFLEEPAATLDFEGEFSPGEAVYGRVMWHPSQHLHSAYSLTIQRLYLCVGSEGYVPVFDPTGQHHHAGPQYGCLQTSPQLKHTFLLLDRDHPHAVDKVFDDVEFQAYFAYELPDLQLLESYPGVDGFVIKVDPLYKINSGYQWYLQVLYNIGPAGPGRVRRSMAAESLSHNGTDLKSLRLRRSSWNVNWPTVISVCVVLLMSTAVGVLYWWFRGGGGQEENNVNSTPTTRTVIKVQTVPPAMRRNFHVQDGTEV